MAIWRECFLGGPKNAFWLIVVSKGVAARDNISRAVLCHKRSGSCLIKIACRNVKTLRASQLCYILRDIDALGDNSKSFERNQQHPIITPKFEHPRRGKPFGKPASIFLEVPDQRWNCARGKGVVAEKNCRIDYLQNLHQ